MVYFTADLHLHHFKILQYCHRPFKNVEEMDAKITRNFLEIIKPTDTLYILGDLSFERKIGKMFLSLFKKEQIRFIMGNHDEAFPKEFMRDYCKSCTEIKDIKVEGQKITLCHYPMISWRGSCHNTWSAHGHNHSNIVNEKFKGKRMNVCVDLHDFKPVSFEQMKEYMKGRENNWDYEE